MTERSGCGKGDGGEPPHVACVPYFGRGGCNLYYGYYFVTCMRGYDLQLRVIWVCGYMCEDVGVLWLRRMHGCCTEGASLVNGLDQRMVVGIFCICYMFCL